MLAFELNIHQKKTRAKGEKQDCHKSCKPELALELFLVARQMIAPSKKLTAAPAISEKGIDLANSPDKKEGIRRHKFLQSISKYSRWCRFHFFLALICG